MIPSPREVSLQSWEQMAWPDTRQWPEDLTADKMCHLWLNIFCHMLTIHPFHLFDKHWLCVCQVLVLLYDTVKVCGNHLQFITEVWSRMCLKLDLLVKVSRLFGGKITNRFLLESSNWRSLSKKLTNLVLRISNLSPLTYRLLIVVRKASSNPSLQQSQS